MSADLIAERIDLGVDLGRALLANGATPAEIVGCLVPIAGSIAELREAQS